MKKKNITITARARKKFNKRQNPEVEIADVVGEESTVR